MYYLIRGAPEPDGSPGRGSRRPAGPTKILDSGFLAGCSDAKMRYPTRQRCPTVRCMRSETGSGMLALRRGEHVHRAHKTASI